MGIYWNKLVAQTRGCANIGGRRLFLALASALMLGFMLMSAVDPAWAAIELAYYRGAATNNAVFLEWATVREVNLNGFEILCKRVSDPDTIYHPIGSRIALGSATSGATYNFDVTSGLIPGERYCFRLREITTDGTPGEAFDLCGYGLGLTPPPTPISVVVSIPVTLTPTVVAVEAVPGLTPAPTLVPTLDPFATPTPTIDPFATATPTLDPFATPVNPNSPVATPTFTPSPTFTLVPTVQGQSVDPNQSPLQTPITQDPNGIAAQVPVTDTSNLTPTAEPTPTATVTTMPVEEPTATATLTTTIPISIISDLNDPNTLPTIPDSAAAVAMVEVTATPLYVVVTATPTPQAAAVVAPTFTPWPTAVPTQTFGFSNLLVPNTQNLMVGLLCLIFMSASGLGALGLVTSVLYMRSQSRRDRLPGPTYERRRF